VTRAVARAACLALVAGLPASAATWTGSASPHDGHHLLVVRPADFRGADGKPLERVDDPGALFDGKAAPVGHAVKAPLIVRHAGRYTLWLRASRLKGSAAALRVELLRDGKPVLRGTALADAGGPGHGGPNGFDAYFEKAKRVPPTSGAGPQERLDERPPDRAALGWALLTRIEHPSGERPLFWWKIGVAPLEPGPLTLRIQPQGSAGTNDVPRVDAALLTTYDALEYPYAGDIDAPPASYIRFRIAEAPADGVAIQARLRIHADPWSTPAAWLTPSGMSLKERVPHAKAGITRWYRLQDIRYAPAFGRAECHLSVGVTPPTAVGATQFAVFPHDDAVLREIDWQEPEGRHISMATDFATHLDRLRTIRDHARENHERAIAATGGRIFPLTRGRLYFSNAWGRATGECFDYMAKSLRLLGFNCVDASADPIRSRQLYGWTSHTGHYWPPAFLPFDKADAHRKYDEHYRHFFDAERELYKGVTVYQIADEPGEISREEMSSPLWVFDAKTGRWVDPVGSSDLNSRTDLHDCVLEGKVEKHGWNVGFRAAIDSASKPSRYAEWMVGRVGPSLRTNLAASRVGIEPEGRSLMQRPGAAVGREPTPFKIVYEADRAALYLGGRLVHQHSGLPRTGGFGFTGGPKAIAELRLRPIRKDEHIAAQASTSKPDELKLDPDEPADGLTLEPAAAPDWAKPKPLKEFIESDWTVAGGMPEAHAAFRKWAAAQGHTPQFFGQASWDAVRMLTVPSLVKTPDDARRFVWSRRYSGALTPRMFALSAEAIHKYAPNPEMIGFVALSGHALYFPSQMPLDMFQLAAAGGALQPGISDWMSLGGWRWDSHQAVAFSVAPYNAGARRYGAEPVSYPMMHCVWPSVFRAYTMLANQVRTVSFYNYGPAYAVTEGHWSEHPGCYRAVHLTANRAAQADDLLSTARVRPSRVAMLYAMSTEYWNPRSSFADKRAAFLALSHEGYQPELVTEGQVADGALAHYDALVVLDPWVAADVQGRIAAWVRAGGLLIACADALTRSEYGKLLDLLASLAGITRSFGQAPPDPPTVRPADGQTRFRPHTVVVQGMPSAIEAPGARVRATYEGGRPAWVERAVDKGKVAAIGHRVGLTCTAKALRLPGRPTVWADTGRALLTVPLAEAKVERELLVSEPLIMASPLSTTDGTVVMLYNMQPTPRTRLRIGLKEPQPPHSVAAFNGSRLQAIPHDYRDGRVWVELERLDGGQMIVVRRKPAPPDGRLERMRQRTEAQLSSKDAQALSAGAWFAGFSPDWRLGGRLVPLLQHRQWQVRRAAAEALGRLRHAEAAEPLAALIAKETDAHVLGDALLAAARVKAPGAAELCGKALAHRQAFVRRQALRALAELGQNHAAPATTAALDDPDARVRHEAIRTVGQSSPALTITRAAAEHDRGGSDAAAWADALAASDEALADYLARDLPGGAPLLLALATRRAHPKLAAALLARLDALIPASPLALADAAIRQADPALARALFARRAGLPKPLADRLPLILEHTFAARLGNVVPDWEAFLAKR